MENSSPCPCGSSSTYAHCCLPIHKNIRKAETAEQLMRSRYTACALLNEAFISASWHPDHRPPSTTLDPVNKWIGLDIKSTQAGGINDETGEVEFVARCKTHGRASRIHEHSRFCRYDGYWVYLDGELK